MTAPFVLHLGIMKRLKWLILAILLAAAAVTLRMTVLAPDPVEVHVAPARRAAGLDPIEALRAE